MRILLYQDETLSLNLDALCSGLSVGRGLDVGRGQAKFRIAGPAVRYDSSYKELLPKVLHEAKTADLCLFFTKTPYDNNYFFEASGKLAIVSFYAWEQLTALPVENGAAYFAAKLLRSELPLPSPHKGRGSCMNSFLWDKTGIDLGMRSGHLCQICKQHIAKRKLSPALTRLLDGISYILDDLGTASRNDENIVDYWKRVRTSQTIKTSETFGVFLCHNSLDKPEVRRIAKQLETRGVRTWLDEEQLRPGLAWQVVLEEQINTIDTVAVFVGSSGIGPWQDMEIRAFLSEFVRRGCPVIPVILPKAEAVPELPIFLRQFTWVDFRATRAEALRRLMWGITGERQRETTI